VGVYPGIDLHMTNFFIPMKYRGLWAYVLNMITMLILWQP